MTNTSVLLAFLILLAIALLIAASISSRRRARVRSAELRSRFGPEYDRAIQQTGSAERAEHELAARARRIERIRFRDLTDADRARFGATWSNIQAKFVDDPAGAVAGANDLVKEIMHARGYPSDDYEQRVADLSVDHAGVIQHYRAAHALAETSRTQQVNTEELRQAVVHYRAIVADLLQESPVQARLREAHA